MSSSSRRARTGAFALVMALLLALGLASPTAAAVRSPRHHRSSGWGGDQAWQDRQAWFAHHHSSGRRPRDERVRAVLRAAMSARGVPYRYGGTSKSSGFDCSGFTRWAWAHGGDALPHSSYEQYRVIRWHVSRRHLEPGDLLFFYSLGHVAIFVGHGRMIEAPHSGARVRVAPIYWQYYTAAARPA